MLKPKNTHLIYCITFLLFSFYLQAQTDKGQLTDTRDNQTYSTVKIGEQWWMSQNLNFRSDSSWVYDNDEQNAAKYGRLYTWQSAMTGCPVDWHLPTDEEWMTLESTLGMPKDELNLYSWRGGSDILGNRLKGPNMGWSNLTGLPSGFNIVPGGFYQQMVIGFVFKKTKFKSVGVSGTYWTATQKSKRAKGNAYYRFVDNENAGIFRDYIYKQHAYAVRCVQD